MNLKQKLLKNKPRTVLLALGGAELVALIILAFVAFGFTSDISSQTASAVPNNPTRRASLDLQFVEPNPIEHYRVAAKNPFKGIERPVVVQRPIQPQVQPVRPVQQPQPPKQIIVVYRGLIFFANGTRAALIEDRHKNEQKFMQINEGLYQYKIIDFDTENLVLEKGSDQFTLPRSQPTAVGEVR
jgi:hypothetical protein